jgi:pyruvate-ferredoxin/flavodoxin oxidoreductase
MTDQEIRELPKVWCVGGDGGLGDIGFQNLSKSVLQNRPNMHVILLDTQVYSNTGGQNSDSSPMPGGGDMNSLGVATQGKMTEKKSVAEILSVGHGSPYVAQLSMANSGRYYRSIMDGLEYRGAAFFQSFTTCQPEHGVGDDMSNIQATTIRDSRGMPDFISNPSLGETGAETIDIRSNPSHNRDWHQVKSPLREEKYTYTVAHWAVTEARFRRHHRPAKEGEGTILLDEFMLRLNQNDVVNRRYLKRDHRAHTPDFEIYIDVDADGKVQRRVISRQMALFCIERRKAWRMLQSRAGVKNTDYIAHKALLTKVDKGKIELEDFLSRTAELYEEEKAALAVR